MIKKILLWTLFAAFVGLIIFGAINRTNEKLADAAPARESNQSQNEGANRGQSGQGQPRSESEEHESELIDSLASPVSSDDLAITAASASNLVSFEGDSEHEWVTYTGTVAAVTTKTLTLNLDDDQTLLIERRPWRFAQENAFTTLPGNRLEVIGFYENDAFQAAQLHDLTTDLLVRLRDETGHPLWASE
jgi:hypothetical protein